MDTQKVPIIIPAYEPDGQFTDLLRQLVNQGITNIIIVNDGSGAKYDDIFSEAFGIVSEYDGVMLTHEVNRGKGRALKTAFEYILKNMPNAVGAVTADSDGQHTVQCIISVADELLNHPGSLILGVRHFGNKDEIPWKSWFGNELTKKTFKLVSGLALSDTQTGLRGISREFMEELMEIPGDRFEFETRMLLASAGKYPIVEIPIETIYESKTNHQTHFKPVKDSLKIYRILFEKFFKYLISSLSSFLVDIALFTIFCSLLKEMGAGLYISISTVMARVLSAVFNYFVNYGFVFRSKVAKTLSAFKYLILAATMMAFSALFVTIISKSLQGVNESVIKAAVDTILFLISYQVQKRFVFK